MENTTCSIEGCANKRTRVSSGWCSKHYQNHQRTGDPLKRNFPKQCEICESEYTPQRSNQKYCSAPCSRKSESDKPCSTENCTGKARWGGKCTNHGRRIHRDKPTHEGVCKHCGDATWFTETRKLYCGRSCAIKSMHDSGKAGKRPPSKLGKAYASGSAEEFKSALLEHCEISVDGCWKWLGRLNANGYANIRVGGKTFLAHRVSYEMFSGEKLGPMDAHHTCAVTNCLNPDHIQPATRAENVAEMKARKSYERRIAELEKQLLATIEK